MIKRLFGCLLAAVWCLSLQVYGGNQVLEIQVTEDVDVEFGIAKIAEDEKGTWTLLEPYRESGVNPEKLHTSQQMQEAVSSLIPYVKSFDYQVTSKNGVARISNLDSGIYLVDGGDLEAYEVMDSLVVVNKEDGVTRLIPKIEKRAFSVQTGDGNRLLGITLAFSASSLFLYWKLDERKRK